MSNTHLSRVPLYEQLAGNLRRSIVEGKFADGRLPSYSEAMRTYGVALVTVRKAMDLLEAEGLIDRVQGSGTFVRKQRSTPGRLRNRTQQLCYVSGTATECDPGSFFSLLLKGSQAVAEELGYLEVLAMPRRGEVPIAIERGQVDGILLGGTYDGGYPVGEFPPNAAEVSEEFVRRLATCGVPVVAMANHTSIPTVHRVVADYDDAMRTAVRLLAKNGHRRISQISGPNGWPGFAEREAAFRRAMSEAGLPVDEGLIVDYRKQVFMDHDGAREQVSAMLGSGERPTAVVVNSGTPTPALEALAAVGLRVPEDMSMICLADARSLELGSAAPNDPMGPDSVTALEMPTVEIGCEGAKRLVRLIEGEVLDSRELRLKLKLRKGRSVAPPRS